MEHVIQVELQNLKLVALIFCPLVVAYMWLKL